MRLISILQQGKQLQDGIYRKELQASICLCTKDRLR